MAKFTLQEIKAKAIEKYEIVKKSPSRVWDKKCRLLNKYEDIINMCDKLENDARYLTDDEFFQEKLKDMLIDIKL